MEINIDQLVAKLREVKQKVFDNEVEGSGQSPTSAVDTVTWALSAILPDAKTRLFSEVIEFYPEYTR